MDAVNVTGNNYLCSIQKGTAPQFGAPLDLALLGAWLGLLCTMVAYWLYDRLDITPRLWAKGEGIWFSQNDVLHAGLILWMIYLAAVVAGHVHDHAVPVGF